MSVIGILMIVGAIIGFIAVGVAGKSGKDLKEWQPQARTYNILLCVLVAIGFLMTMFAIVPRGHVGVVTQFSAVTGSYRTQGLQFKSPIQKLDLMNIQTQKEEVVATAASKDLQDVSTTIALNYHLNEASAPAVYRDLGTDYIKKVVDPAIQETVKQVTARYNAEDLIIHRETIKNDIFTELTTRLTPRGINVEAVSITDFKFSVVFTKAIEEKVVAVQQALQAQNKLAQIQWEAQQVAAAANGTANAAIAQATGQRQAAITRAEGEAQAILTVAKAQADANQQINATLTPAIIQYAYVQKIADGTRVIILPNGQQFILPSDLLNDKVSGNITK